MVQPSLEFPVVDPQLDIERPAAGAADVLIVIAAYQEAERVGSVVRELDALGYEVVVVDDGSSDETASSAAAAGALVLRHRLNRGQGAALQTGIEFALRRRVTPPRAIVTFDADGQHDTASVAALLAPILAGECDVVLGSRFLGSAEGMPFSRRIVLRLGVLFTRLTSGLAVTDTHNGLRAFSTRAARALDITLDRMAHASEILEQIHRCGLSWREVPVRIRYTPELMRKGQSNWNAAAIAARVLWKKLSP